MLVMCEHTNMRQELKIKQFPKSIDGSCSKIHLAVDEKGNPIELITGGGATHDVKVAPRLIDCLDLEETEVLCADKGYDSEIIGGKTKSTKVKAYIPKKSNSEYMD